MKIKELIEQLKRYNQDLNVEFENLEGDTAEDFSIDEAFGVLVIKEF